MNTSKMHEECQRRFELQEEYLGTDKPVNRVEPLVSVCTVTYQHAGFIRECLDGILMQETTFPFELIVGEDGSTDGTREICVEYAERHPDRIRLFLRDRALSQFPAGHHTVRFNGHWTRQSARGKYIALCEGDDYWTNPQKLQKQVEFLEEHEEYSGSFHDTTVIENGKAPRPHREHAEKQRFQLQDVLTVWSPFHTSSFVARTHALRVLPPEIYYVRSGDMALFIITARSGPLWRCPGAMSVYRKHTGGVTRAPENNGFRLFVHRVQMYRILKAFMPGSADHPFDELIRGHHMRLQREYAGAGMRHKTDMLRYLSRQLGVASTLAFVVNGIQERVYRQGRKLRSRIGRLALRARSG